MSKRRLKALALSTVMVYFTWATDFRRRGETLRPWGTRSLKARAHTLSLPPCYRVAEFNSGEHHARKIRSRSRRADHGAAVAPDVAIFPPCLIMLLFLFSLPHYAERLKWKDTVEQPRHRSFLSSLPHCVAERTSLGRVAEATVFSRPFSFGLVYKSSPHINSSL